MPQASPYLWPHQRRFNSAPQYFRRTYGGRLQKVSIDAGFTCPNRDGTCGTGGCTFCNNEAFNPEDFYFPELDDYLDFLVDFLEQLSPDIVVERCFAEAPPRLNRTPVQWTIRNDQLLQKLEARLEARQTWQGRLWAGAFHLAEGGALALLESRLLDMSLPVVSFSNCRMLGGFGPGMGRPAQRDGTPTITRQMKGPWALGRYAINVWSKHNFRETLPQPVCVQALDLQALPWISLPFYHSDRTGGQPKLVRKQRTYRRVRLSPSLAAH